MRFQSSRPASGDLCRSWAPQQVIIHSALPQEVQHGLQLWLAVRGLGAWCTGAMLGFVAPGMLALLPTDAQLTHQVCGCCC